MKVPFSTVKYIHEEHKNELYDAFDRVMKSAWYIRGAECKKFEAEYAEYCEAKHVVGCGNGLDSISIALQAFGIGKGDEVIIPAFTFIATAIAVEHTGATPILVDVEPETTLIDVNLIEKAITPRTKAIVPVHLYGQPVDIESIEAIAKRYNLYVIYDSAQAHGAKYKGKNIGTYGDAVCFSFYPGKNLGALGDAGAISTNSDKSELMSMIGNYGSSVRYHHDVIGMNSRLDEIQSAFLRVKLKTLDKVNSERKRLAQRYLSGITNPTVKLPVQKNGDHVWHIFAVHCENRDAVQKYLSDNEIETNIHYPIPIHLQKSFAKYGYRKGSFPVTERLAETELSLPLYYGMTDAEIDYVIETINNMRI
jgi:dTDP-4-amino-4,6-dideoxygalactose transaminase